MNRRTLVWAAVFALAATLLALGWFPGAADAALGPRLGLIALLTTMSFILVVGSFAAAIRTRSTRIDAQGGCPVGAKCPCGQFNFKPRPTCRQCGAATDYTHAKAA